MITNLMLLFLAQNNLLDKFIANLDEQGIEGVNSGAVTCLAGAFLWRESNEGPDFWNQQNNAFCKFEKSFQ